MPKPTCPSSYIKISGEPAWFSIEVGVRGFALTARDILMGMATPVIELYQELFFDLLIREGCRFAAKPHNTGYGPFQIARE